MCLFARGSTSADTYTHTHQAEAAQGMLALCKTGGAPSSYRLLHSRSLDDEPSGLRPVKVVSRGTRKKDAAPSSLPKVFAALASLPDRWRHRYGARALSWTFVLVRIERSCTWIPFLLALCTAVICSSSGGRRRLFARWYFTACDRISRETRRRIFHLATFQCADADVNIGTGGCLQVKGR